MFMFDGYINNHEGEKISNVQARPWLINSSLDIINK